MGRRRISRVFRTSMLALAVSTACDSSPTRENNTDVTLTISVLDTTGDPVVAAPLYIYAFYKADERYLATGVITDSTGVFQLRDTLGRALGALDSVRIAVPWMGGECNPFVPRDTVLTPTHGATSLSLELAVTPAGPPATLNSGESCGLGFGPPGFLDASAFWLRLQIDSITDSIRGRWRLDFNVSSASQEGVVIGPITPDTVALRLEPTRYFQTCTPRYRLLATLSGGVTVGIARLIDDNGCYAYPAMATPFRLLIFDTFEFP